MTVTAPRCVQCQTPGSADDCPSGMVCNQLNFCASCSSNDDCPRDRPICSADTRSCVTCDDDAGLYCPRQRPICQSGQCLGCEYHSDCGSVMKCDQKTNRCELCLNDEVCELVILLAASSLPVHLDSLRLVLSRLAHPLFVWTLPRTAPPFTVNRGATAQTELVKSVEETKIARISSLTATRVVAASSARPPFRVITEGSVTLAAGAASTA